MRRTVVPVTGTEHPVTVSRWSRTASGSTGKSRGTSAASVVSVRG